MGATRPEHAFLSADKVQHAQEAAVSAAAQEAYDATQYRIGGVSGRQQASANLPVPTPEGYVGAKDTNPKTQFGATKPALFLVPSVAILHCAMSMEDGAKKYGAYNWRKDPVSLSTYISGAMRHLQCFLDGEETARDTGVSNLGSVMANCAIMLDAMSCGTAIDDRPLPGKAGEIQDELQTWKKAQLARERP